LRCCAGSIELVDVSAELPELKYKPGLTQWKVWFSSHYWA